MKKYICKECGKEFDDNGRANKFCSNKCWYPFRVKSVTERLWKKVKKTKTCWLWQGGGNRYGVISRGDVCISTHRLSFEIHFGKIPEGMQVCHTCDVPLCVNPKHLFLGTGLDNSRDKCKKGRQAKGEKTGTSKFTLKIIQKIRNEVDNKIHSQNYLAKKYKVYPSTISSIVRNKTWKV